MFKPSANSTWILAYVWRSRLQQREKHGHKKDIGHLVQSGGEILVLRTGSRKMSINICSGNVLGYKQATYQHNVQYVSLDNASHNVVICRFDLFTFASKTGYQTLIVGAISMIMQLVYPVLKPCTINLECFDKKCQHAPWLFHRVACVAASLSLCNILDSGLQYLLLWTWAGRQVEDDSATVLDKMTSSTAKISLLFEHSVVCELWVSRVPRYWWEAIDWKDSWCESIITHPMADNCRLRSPATYISSWQPVEVHVEY